MSAAIRRNISPKYETGDDGRPIIPPMVTPDLHTRLANPHQYETDPGTNEVLHNVIDFRFPLIAWITTISTNLDISSFSSSPAASPQSLLGYCFSLVVAFNWFSDICHNLAPSQYAQTLLDTRSSFVSFVEDMLDLNVPSFMVPELLQWQTVFAEFAATLRRITCFDTADFPMILDVIFRLLFSLDYTTSYLPSLPVPRIPKSLSYSTAQLSLQSPSLAILLI
jgi:hypothetical protein